MENITETQLKALMDERDIRYQQRWEAQEKALASALSAAEKAVAAALIAQEKAVANAFNAQEKSVAAALAAAESSGKKSGLNDGWVILLGIASFLGAVGAIFMAFKK
jgi:hypothetical protein